jgi:uncharacterized 2Fe-2S/4Fe-4S cluster protein (DUF4445 family)
LEVARWETPVLGDSPRIQITGRQGFGVAIDLGTTTLVAQLVDLAGGRVLGVRTALNPQAIYGSDVMSRIEAALHRGAGPSLTGSIRAALGGLVSELIAPLGADAGLLTGVVIVGNTAMHHMFCGFDLDPLAHVPFQTDRGGMVEFAASELGWAVPAGVTVRFLPCISGFVGSDILAGVLATRMHESTDLVGLVDLGTNAEIVIGDRRRLLCTSAAAGPAFEGGMISMGMRAATGAIARVSLETGGPACHVLGDVPPRGICGSGLVDAVAVGLDVGVIQPNGRLAPGNSPWVLAAEVSITQSDIRALQLAKAAIAAGIQLLLRRLGAFEGDISRLYLAGAFGNYVSRESANRIGLISVPPERVCPAGNTALLGARLALFASGAGDFSSLVRRIEHVPLAQEIDFQDAFAAKMAFPVSAY